MKQRKRELLLGAHMSIAGGLEKSIERAESIGCTCMQIFTKSNQQWKTRDLTEEEITAFTTKLATSSIRSVVVHTSYLINIGSSNNELNKKSVESLAQELQRCLTLSIPYLVMHPGSAGTSDKKECLDRIAYNLTHLLKENPGDTMILLENTAGQGSVAGSTFEELAYIRKHVENKERIGFCIDTCHLFAAGYDFRTNQTYEDLWQKFEEIIGLEHLKIIHLNDSKKGLNSHLDRHEHIGKGTLGIQAFSLLCNDPRFFDIPKILETPKDDLSDDLNNMNIIRGLLTDSTKKSFIFRKKGESNT